MSDWVFRDRTYIDRSFFMSVQFQFLGSHLYRLVICLVSLSQGHTYIDRSFFLLVWVQFEFLGPHLYQLVIVMSVWVLSFWDRTYIDQPSSYQFVFSLSFETTPISIDHYLVNLSLSFRTTLISIGHLSCRFEFSLSLNFFYCTYINRSFSMSVWVFGTTPISIGHYLVSLCLVQVETALISIGHRLVSLSLSFWRSEPQFQFGIQSPWAYSFRHFESSSFLTFDVQSHFSPALSFRLTTPGIHIH